MNHRRSLVKPMRKDNVNVRDAVELADLRLAEALWALDHEDWGHCGELVARARLLLSAEMKKREHLSRAGQAMAKLKDALQ